MAKRENIFTVKELTKVVEGSAEAHVAAASKAYTAIRIKQKKMTESQADAMKEQVGGIAGMIQAIINLIVLIGKKIEEAGEKMIEFGNKAETSFGKVISGAGRAMDAFGTFLQNGKTGLSALTGGWSAVIQTVKDYKQATLDAEASIFTAVLATETKTLKLKIGNLEKKLALEKEGTAAYLAIQSSIYDAQKELATKEQQIKIAQIGADMQVALASAETIRGKTARADAKADITAAFKALIAATKEAYTFERGGMIGGKRHSQGGTMINAEAGEAVLNRGAVSMLGGGRIDALNNAGMRGMSFGGGAGGVDSRSYDQSKNVSMAGVTINLPNITNKDQFMNWMSDFAEQRGTTI
jgi:hypothetical protein